MRDRSSKPRLKFHLELDLGSAHNFYAARAGSLGEVGLFIESDAAIAIDTPLQLSLSLDGEPIESAARVVWQLRDAQGKPEGVGVELIDLSGAAIRAIGAFMRRRKPLLFGVPGPPPLPHTAEPLRQAS